ncbi:hypothetical protein [Vibrio parahaemolyticus]|uniref:hypothetical protein n=1 Tax=Vibrio parahaemolyticus TaxID=670 RepID=UPI00211A207B|nr:hypothetical protein [Vibrio parahaemolyticus]MCQ9080238.1 hypothetical protein [Vibrio parahaemolyticus]
MQVNVTKIQFLCDRETGNPLYYCHNDDYGHSPSLSISSLDGVIRISSLILFKVKKRNPQRKNRVDIYMSLSSAIELGNYLSSINRDLSSTWVKNNTDPNASRQGAMELPAILMSYSGKINQAVGKVASGMQFKASSPWMYCELEEPHNSHIKMSDREVHLAVPFTEVNGVFDEVKTWPVIVAEHELQRGANEENPISKTMGRLMLELPIEKAVTLGNSLLELAKFGEHNA